MVYSQRVNEWYCTIQKWFTPLLKYNVHTITLNNGSGNSEFICQQYFESSGLKTNVQYSVSKWLYEESEIA